MDEDDRRDDDKKFVTKVIGEVLSDNSQTLEDLLVFATEASINRLGDCGETPAHIAIYKHHCELLLQLLQAGADPMVWNEKGDSLIHTSVLLGHLDMLKMLYATGKCNLELQNMQGQTPMDIATAPFQEKDLVASNLFKNWSRADEEIDAEAEINEGRKLCVKYLKEKIEVDRFRKIQRNVRAISEHMMNRDKQRRWMTDATGIVQINYRSGLEYPTRQGHDLISSQEQTYFKRYKDALNDTTTKVFANEVILNSLLMNR